MSSGREEQQLPDTNDAEYCQDSVRPRIMAALEQSMAQGILKYRTALQPFNGRDVQQDMEEEALDLIVYMEQNRREREGMIAFLIKVARLPIEDDPIANEAYELLTSMGIEL